jgi:hypothetical protein
MNEPQTYYFTFGQAHPLKDNWVEIHAPNVAAARAEIIKLFGTKWGFVYTDADFKPEYFPGGRAGNVVKVYSHD